MGFLDFISGSDDPSTQDSSGLSQADRRQVLFGGLGQLGATLLAAGQPMEGSQRAQFLAQAGQVPQQMQQARLSAVQAKLAGQKYKDDQQANALLKTPEFQAALAKLPPEMQAIAKLGPTQAVQAVQQHTLLERQQAQLEAQNTREDKRYTAMADRDDKRSETQMRLLNEREKGLYERLGISQQGATDRAGMKPTQPGQLITMPDGSRRGTDVFGRPVNIPAPAAPPGPTSQLPGFQVPGMTPQSGPRPAGFNPAQAQLAAPPVQSGPPPQQALDLSQLDPSPHGWELDGSALDKLPPEEQRKAYEIATYKREPLPIGRQRTDAKNTLIMDTVGALTKGKYDPSLYKRIQDANKEISSTGQTGKAIQSMNTAGGHMADLWDATLKLSNGQAAPLNNLLNNIKKNTGDVDVLKAETAAQAVGEEVAKALHGAGAIGQEDKATWVRKFAATKNSPEQMQGVLMEARQLMIRRENSYRTKYTDDTNGAQYRGKIWGDDVRKGLDDIASHRFPSAKAGGGPSAGFKKNGYTFKGGDPSDKSNWDKD